MGSSNGRYNGQNGLDELKEPECLERKTGGIGSRKLGELHLAYSRRGSFNGNGNSDVGEMKKQLVESYLHIVKIIAKRKSERLPSNIEFGDLVSYGVIGLCEAIDTFNPERGWKFETYASRRIRGAILDGLREMDYLRRGERSRVREIEERAKELERALGRKPFDEEVAEGLGISLGEYFERIVLRKKISLDSPLANSEGRDSESILSGLTEADARRRTSNEVIPTAEDQAEYNEMREIVRVSVDEREFRILEMYYESGMTQNEISEREGISDIRVWQLIKRAREKLREPLRDYALA